jgi:ParB/RepB/Spo0J family partition protein
MKRSTAIATTEPTIVVNELVMDEGYYARIEIARIRISPDNRKRFNEQALQELAASIKDMGVAQPVLLRPVTPTEVAPQEFEIVAGERRYRASTIAGLLDIPAMVRSLTDLQAAKIRILENLQREDPHPMEEAEGYQLLMMQHGYTADQLVGEIKKSRSYVFGRLKLCSLTTDVRERFLDDQISASIALLIARIPLPTLQVKALGEILKPLYGEPLSYRQAAAHIQQRYMLDLTTAIFERGDAKLLASAGACTKCPKRTGNQPEIFSGVSADVCTDPDCFAEKRLAHHALTLVQANKKGIPVLEGEEASQVRSMQWTATSDYVSEATYIHSFSRNAPSTGNSGSVGSRMKSDQLPPVAAYLKSDDGSMLAVYSRPAMQTALEQASVCETVEVHAARMKDAEATGTPGKKALTAAQTAERAKDRAMTEGADAQTAFRIALYKQVRAHGATNGFSLQSLREFAKLALTIYSLPTELKDIYGFNASSRDEIAAHIDQAGLREIQLLFIDMVVGEMLTVGRWDFQNDSYLDDDFSGVVAMARNEYIDPESVMSGMAPVPLSVSDLNADGVAKLLKSNPFRVNEIRRSITTDRPDLVKAMDKAARSLGYAHSFAGWYVRPGEDLGSMQAAPAPAQQSSDAALTAPPSSLSVDEGEPGDAVAVDGENHEAAIADPAPTKKAPKSKPSAAKSIKPKEATAAAPQPVVKHILSPAAAWPFPKSSTAALAPAAAESVKSIPFTQESA